LVCWDAGKIGWGSGVWSGGVCPAHVRWLSVSATSPAPKLAVGVNSAELCEGEEGLDVLVQRSGVASRRTLVVALTDEEFAELQRALSEADMPNMSLLVYQAIQTGLEKPEPRWVQRKRSRTVNIHVSKILWEKIRLKAQLSRVTQQALLRSLIFDYIRNKRWMSGETGARKQAMADRS
jgi:hypothetical protein